MLKPEELRIGNYVNEGMGGIVTPTEIDSFNSMNEYFILYSAIPLTEEWLYTFGFTLQPVPSAYGFDCNKVFKGGVLRGAWSRETKAFYCLEILINGTHKKIEYVHDFQNFFYSYTNKEELRTTLPV